MSGKLAETAPILGTYSEQTDCSMGSTVDKIRYEMQDVQFYLSDASTYLHSLGTSAWASSDRDGSSNKRHNLSPPSCSTTSSEGSDSGLASKLRTMIRTYPLSLGGHPRYRGSGRRERLPFYPSYLS